MFGITIRPGTPAQRFRRWRGLLPLLLAVVLSMIGLAILTVGTTQYGVATRITQTRGESAHRLDEREQARRRLIDLDVTVRALVAIDPQAFGGRALIGENV